MFIYLAMSKIKLKNKLNGLELSIEILTKEADKIRKELESIKKNENTIKTLSTDPTYEKLLRKLINGITTKTLSNKSVPPVAAGLTLDVLGRAGEIAFQNYLHEILTEPQVKIKWLNQGYETKKPYDFIVTLCGVEFYIDVKTTRSQFDNQLYMSQAELKFARTHKGRYFVARLFQWDEKPSNKYKADSFNVKMLTIDQTIKQFKLK